MNYENYTKEVIKKGFKLSKDEMQFAYLMFYKTFGESIEKSIESVLFLDSLEY